MHKPHIFEILYLVGIMEISNIYICWNSSQNNKTGPGTRSVPCKKRLHTQPNYSNQVFCFLRNQTQIICSSSFVCCLTSINSFINLFVCCATSTNNLVTPGWEVPCSTFKGWPVQSFVICAVVHFLHQVLWFAFCQSCICCVSLCVIFYLCICLFLHLCICHFCWPVPFHHLLHHEWQVTEITRATKRATRTSATQNPPKSKNTAAREEKCTSSKVHNRK